MLLSGGPTGKQKTFKTRHDTWVFVKKNWFVSHAKESGILPVSEAGKPKVSAKEMAWNLTYHVEVLVYPGR